MNLSNIKVDTLCAWDNLVTVNFDIEYSSGKVDNVSIDIDKCGSVVNNSMLIVNKGTKSDYIEYGEFCDRLSNFEGEIAKSFVDEAMGIALKYEGLRDKLKAKHLYVPTYKDYRALMDEIVVCKKLQYKLKSQSEVNETNERIALLKEALKLKESKIAVFYEELSVLDKEENVEMSKIAIGL